MTLEELRALKPQILEVAARHGVSNIRVFGSVARGDAHEKSDVDFLIDMEREKSLLTLAALKGTLENMIGCKVDLVEPQTIQHPLMRQHIFADATAL